jgi:hypothetical protein
MAVDVWAASLHFQKLLTAITDSSRRTCTRTTEQQQQQQQVACRHYTLRILLFIIRDHDAYEFQNSRRDNTAECPLECCFDGRSVLVFQTKN